MASMDVLMATLNPALACACIEGKGRQRRKIGGEVGCLCGSDSRFLVFRPPVSEVLTVLPLKHWDSSRFRPDRGGQPPHKHSAHHSQLLPTLLLPQPGGMMALHRSVSAVFQNINELWWRFWPNVPIQKNKCSAYILTLLSFTSPLHALLFAARLRSVQH